MKATNTIYLSDILAVPMPKTAVSHEDYLRKVRNRKLMWSLLPYLVRGIVIAGFLMLSMGGLTMMAIGFGG